MGQYEYGLLQTEGPIQIIIYTLNIACMQSVKIISMEAEVYCPS